MLIFAHEEPEITPGHGFSIQLEANRIIYHADVDALFKMLIFAKETFSVQSIFIDLIHELAFNEAVGSEVTIYSHVLKSYAFHGGKEELLGMQLESGDCFRFKWELSGCQYPSFLAFNPGELMALTLRSEYFIRIRFRPPSFGIDRTYYYRLTVVPSVESTEDEAPFMHQDSSSIRFMGVLPWNALDYKVLLASNELYPDESFPIDLSWQASKEVTKISSRIYWNVYLNAEDDLTTTKSLKRRQYAPEVSIKTHCLDKPQSSGSVTMTASCPEYYVLPTGEFGKSEIDAFIELTLHFGWHSWATLNIPIRTMPKDALKRQ